MIFKDLVALSDKQRVAEIAYERAMETSISKKVMPKETFLKRYTDFIQREILAIEPGTNVDGMMLIGCETFEDWRDDEKGTWCLEPVEKKELDEFVYDENFLSKAGALIASNPKKGEIVSFMKANIPATPTVFSVITEKWGEILGYEVFEDSVKGHVDECVFWILNEMTFFGYTKQTWQKGIDDLEKALDEADEDIKEGRTYSADEVFQEMRAEIGISDRDEDCVTEENAEEGVTKSLLCSLKSTVSFYNELRMYTERKNEG